MQLSNIPGKLTLPFANAGGKNTIPVASQIGITPGAASLVDGFPPLTRTPIAAGGVPPSGLDMNGLLFEMSALDRWFASGAAFPYDSVFATDVNVGGYPKGARVLRSDGLGYWLNTSDNNITDPESAGSAAAGWVPDVQAGTAPISMTNASVTLTPSQYGKRLIVITGALTANLNLIFPPIAMKWAVLNETTGAFSITAKTAAGSGATVPQGHPADVINDGVNIQTNLSAMSDITNMLLGVSLIGGAQRAVDTIIALRSLPKSGSPSVQVAGYHPGAYALKNPSGGGIFNYNATDTSTGWYGTGSIAGTTLTVASTIDGTLAIGQQLNYGGSDGSVYVIAGSGTSWTLNVAPGTIALGSMTGDDGGNVIVALDGGRWYRQNQTFSIDVVNFGARVDGVSDDTYQTQSAANAIPNGFGATLTYPAGSGTSLISDQIDIGKFNVDANNDVLGWVNTKSNLTVNLNGNCIRWNGADQPGVTKVTKTDTVGTYPLITDCKAMFSVVACQGFRVENGFMDGVALNGTSRVYSGIWFQGTQARTSFSNLRILGPRIALRHGCRWDLNASTTYFGYGASPYAIANNVFGINPAVTGGWAGDTQHHSCCSYHGTLAHYSTESDQNLSINFSAVNMGEGGSPSTYGVLMVGGRITGAGVSCNVAATYDVYMPTGNNSFVCTDWHSESVNAGTIYASTVAGSCNVGVINADAVKLVIPAGAASVKFNAIDSNVSITRYDGTGELIASLSTCSVSSVGVVNTGAKNLVRIKLNACDLTGAILPAGSAQNCYLETNNCFPISNLPVSSGEYTSISTVLNGGSYDTIVESYDGQSHKIRRRSITLPNTTVTLIGTISTDGIGASSTGDCLLKLHFSTAVASNFAAVYGQYAFSWNRNSANVMTVSPVAVINESKALNGFTTFVPAVTVAVVGTTLQISVAQTNDIAATAYLELNAEVYAGGAYGVESLPLWS